MSIFIIQFFVDEKCTTQYMVCEKVNRIVKLKKGDIVYSPRICHLEIQKVFRDEANARKAGYSEQTDYKDHDYGILGKSIGMNRMIFAAYRKEGQT